MLLRLVLVDCSLCFGVLRLRYFVLLCGCGCYLVVGFGCVCLRVWLLFMFWLPLFVGLLPICGLCRCFGLLVVLFYYVFTYAVSFMVYGCAFVFCLVYVGGWCFKLRCGWFVVVFVVPAAALCLYIMCGVVLRFVWVIWFVEFDLFCLNELVLCCCYLVL